MFSARSDSPGGVHHRPLRQLSEIVRGYGQGETMPVIDDWATMTVTVVDDEPVVQDVLVRAARSWNYDCQAAASAEQALELLERRLTPIVVTDLRMPGQGGVWLVREVRRRWPEVSIIVLTAGQDQDADRQRRELSLAAKLHDIGKVGVPEAILNKPGPLTLAESMVVREHPAIGERILRSIIRNQHVLSAIRGHHERVDGTGYPDGLKG